MWRSRGIRVPQIGLLRRWWCIMRQQGCSHESGSSVWPTASSGRIWVQKTQSAPPLWLLPPLLLFVSSDYIWNLSCLLYVCTWDPQLQPDYPLMQQLTYRLQDDISIQVTFSSLKVGLKYWKLVWKFDSWFESWFDSFDIGLKVGLTVWKLVWQF